MKSTAGIAALLLVTCATAQQSPVATPKRRTIPAAVAGKRLCGISGGLSTSETANSRTENAAQQPSMCGGPIVPPLYPAEAKQQGIEGTVFLKAVIGADGTVKELRVIDGHPLLTPAAMEAVKRWKYKPYYVDDKPVEVETTVTVNFTLQKADDSDHLRLSTPVVQGWRNLALGSPVYALDDAATKGWLERALIQRITVQTGIWRIWIERGNSVFRIYPYLSNVNTQSRAYQGIVLKVNGDLSVEDLIAAIRKRTPTVRIDEYDVFGADGVSIQKYSRSHEGGRIID